MSQTGPKDWRELCRKAAEELDPDKLMDLIVEINKALDEQSKKRKGISECINNADPEKDPGNRKRPFRNFAMAGETYEYNSVRFLPA